MTYPCMFCHKLCSPIDSFVVNGGIVHRACQPLGARRQAHRQALPPGAININVAEPPPRFIPVPVWDPRMRA